MITPPYEIFIYIAGDTLRIIGNNKKHISGIAGRFYVYIILPEMETNIRASFVDPFLAEATE